MPADPDETGPAAAPASQAQLGIWIAQEMAPQCRAFNVAFELRPAASLDPDSVRHALGEIVRRHPALRTRFSERQGQLLRTVDPEGAVPLTFGRAGADLEHRLARQAEEAFDLRRQFGWRAALLTGERDEQVLSLVFHHILVDAWSIGIILREFGEIYGGDGREAAAPPTSAGAAEADAASERPRRTGPGACSAHCGAAASLELDIPPALLRAIGSLAQECGTTVSAALLAAFRAALGSEPGGRIPIVGVPFGRREDSELQQAVGLFVNTSIVSLDFGDSPSFVAATSRAQQALLDAFAVRDVPFEEQLTKLSGGVRDAGSGADAVFNLRSYAAPVVGGAPAELRQRPPSCLHVDFALSLGEESDGLRGRLDYAGRVSAERAQAVRSAFLKALERAVDDPLAAIEAGPASSALSQPSAAAQPAAARAAPTRTEREIALIWRELLGHGDFGSQDSFFASGGHSLLALKLSWRISKALGVEIKLRDIFQQPTLAGLAALVDSRASVGDGGIRKLPYGSPKPLSFAQERMLFLHAWNEGDSSHNVPLAVRLSGPIRFDGLQAALTDLVDRHEILRTRYMTTAEGSFAVVDAPATVPLALESRSDFAAARQRALDLASEPFDLERRWSIRSGLIEYGRDEYLLWIALHHIATDGYSVRLLWRDLSAFYAARLHGTAADLPPLAIQYSDAAAFERAHAASEAYRLQLEYWRARLADAPPASEIASRGPHEGGRNGSAAIRLPVAPELSAEVERLARQARATSFMVLLACLKIAFALRTGQHDMVFGIPVAARAEPEKENLIGLFVNTLPVRTTLSPEDSIAAAIAKVRDTCFEAFENIEIPFDALVAQLNPERRSGRHPIFQIMFAMREPALPIPSFEGVTVEVELLEPALSKFDLSTSAWKEENGGFVFELKYRTDAVDDREVEEVGRLLLEAIAGACRNPGCRIGDLRERSEPGGVPPRQGAGA